MTQHDRLQQKIKELQEHFELLSQKIQRLRIAHGIETDPSIKLKIEKQIEQAEIERDRLEKRLESIEIRLYKPKKRYKKVLYSFFLFSVLLLISVIYQSKFSLYLTNKLYKQQKKLVSKKEDNIDSDEALWVEPITGMEFVWIPGGCYEMGLSQQEKEELIQEVGIKEYKFFYSDAFPAHRVCVDSFWIGKYEVTQEEWSKLMGKFEFPEIQIHSGDAVRTESMGEYLEIFGVDPATFLKGGRYPAVIVFWNDAQEFIQKLSVKNKGKYQFRLPTEAEWEYACRSGGKYQKYSGGNDIDLVGWYKSNSRKSIHPVGSKNPNGFNVFDMSGNVWEWVMDICDNNTYSEHERNNPIHISDGACQGARGGSWELEKAFARCTSRFGSDSGWAGTGSGFRVIRVP